MAFQIHSNNFAPPVTIRKTSHSIKRNAKMMHGLVTNKKYTFCKNQP